MLRKRFGDDVVTVTHSRFLAADRAAKDAELQERFGPRGHGRPDRHIVVASQVVEQSLDIDFDLLVTDLAPVDLMLQRMGRLHRHPRKRPKRLTRARCLVTGVDWQATPPRPVKGSRAVYQATTRCCAHWPCSGRIWRGSRCGFRRHQPAGAERLR